MSDELIEFFHNLSFALNPLVYLICILILLHYGKNAKLNPESLADWLILGILIAFVGEIVDNLFWNAAWAAYGIGDGSHQKWMRYGPVSNSIFRQLFIIIAGLCHIYPVVIIRSQLRIKTILAAVILSFGLFELMSYIGGNL